jgi:hypothetical protein
MNVLTSAIPPEVMSRSSSCEIPFLYSAMNTILYIYKKTPGH